MELVTCEFCKTDLDLLQHHVQYLPNEETITVCKKCHYKITTMIKTRGGRFLCVVCGRHFTSNKDGICWKCKNPDEIDCFGLTAKDKTPVIFKCHKSCVTGRG